MIVGLGCFIATIPAEVAIGLSILLLDGFI